MNAGRRGAKIYAELVGFAASQTPIRSPSPRPPASLRQGHPKARPTPTSPRPRPSISSSPTASASPSTTAGATGRSPHFGGGLSRIPISPTKGQTGNLAAGGGRTPPPPPSPSTTPSSPAVNTTKIIDGQQLNVFATSPRDESRRRGVERLFPRRPERGAGVQESLSMHRVVITGMGWITPMGHDIEGVWKRLLNGESGIEKPHPSTPPPSPPPSAAESTRLADHLQTSPPQRLRTQHPVRPRRLPPGMERRRAPNRTTRPRPRRHLPRQRRRLPRLRRYTTAGLASWKPETNSNDAVKWAQVAMERMRPVIELEQEPNMPLSHLAPPHRAARPRAQLPHRSAPPPHRPSARPPKSSAAATPTS